MANSVRLVFKNISKVWIILGEQSCRRVYIAANQTNYRREDSNWTVNLPCSACGSLWPLFPLHLLPLYIRNNLDEKGIGAEN